MSLLDENLDISIQEILERNFEYLIEPGNYDNPSANSLYNVFWRVAKWLGEGNKVEIKVPDDIPDKVLVGWDFLLTPDIKRLYIKLFDINKIETRGGDSIVYIDDNGKCLHYNFNRTSNVGKFGGYRLHIEHIIHSNGENRIGFLVLDIEDLLNKYINKKYYIRLPVTDMEKYLIVQNKTTDHLQIFTKQDEGNRF